MTNSTIVHRHISIWCQILLTTTHVIGIIGNVIALMMLRYISKKFNKTRLLLTALASNDLIALITSMVLMHMQLYYPKYANGQMWFCVFRVILRAFGLASGCIAIVMAIERWFALVKPFEYKKYVTYKVVLRAIVILWITGAAVTCLPFANFGLFYNSEIGCLRYRDATEMKDIIYAYIFFVFGTLLCACIVWCNLGVIKELAKIGNRKRILVRRISRSLSRNSEKIEATGTPTGEELAFAKLMAVLCISFVICWMPQMISILMAQLGPKRESNFAFYRIADILIAVHFTLDPYVYVLLRFKRNRNNRQNSTSLVQNGKNGSFNTEQSTKQILITP